jgi:hypothetical protein
VSRPVEPIPTRWLLLLYALALGLRLAHLAAFQAHPYLGLPRGDALYNLLWAARILDGPVLGTGTFHQSPVLAYLLAAASVLTDRPGLAVQLLQASLGSLGAVLLALSGARVARSRAGGLLAGLLAATYGPFVYHDALLLKESLGVFFVSLWIWLALRAADSGRLRDHALAGLALGTLWLIRDNASLLALVHALWCLLGREARRAAPATRLRRAAAVLAATLIPVLPLTARNVLVAGEPVLTIHAGGQNLYSGNHPGSDGFYHPLPFMSADPMHEEEDFRAEAERRTGRKLRATEVSRFWTHETLRAIGEAPLQWLALVGKKVLIFWNAYEIPDNYDFELTATFLPHLRWLPGFRLAAVLGLAGICLRTASPLMPLLRSAVVVYMLSVALFFVYSRYRIPVVPLLLVAGSAAVCRAVRLARARRLLPLAGMAAAAAAALALTSTSVCDAERGRIASFTWARYGVFLLQRGETEPARAALQRALALAPYNALALGALGDVALRSQDVPRAAELYVEAWRRGLARPDLLRRAAGALAASGRREAARELLLRARALRPDDAEPLELLRALGLDAARPQRPEAVPTPAPAGAAP